ncbi:MAG TPA: hypothetical protein DCM05_17845 [Elusimicrobia bacterium]|nr:hypothetical protein [Elusimicrobiota bacterium]
MPPETDNLKLEEIFLDDQKDRERVYDSSEEVAKLKERDAQRRKRVYVMMDLGEIRTMKDLYRASVILQHGHDAADFLTAHRLATLSAILGHKTARWLLAATLDRYLMAIDQPQVYGTQFEYSASEKRYQLKLPIGDAMFLDFEKELLGVPTVAERLKQLNSQFKK